jgi:hypothetical protein
MKKCIRTLLGISLLASTAIANAALVSRLSGQAYYDDSLDITWVADANLAQTSGYDTDGWLTWDDANAYVASLNSGSYLGVSSWRLPNWIDTSTPGCNFTYDGSDCGYNSDTATGELASLYYDTLGNLSNHDASGTLLTDGWGPLNTGPFANIQHDDYWYAQEAPDYPLTLAMHFGFDEGSQGFAPKTDETNYVWVVTDGDIGASVVPIPAAAWLFGSALAGLGWLRRRQTG